MHPLALLGAVTLVGGGLYYLSKKNSAPMGGSAIVSTLTKGKSYAVVAMITKEITDDPRWAALGNLPNEQKVKQLIASTFAQSGCKMLSTPAVRDEAEMQKANAGEPSMWVFNMQWLLDDPYIQRQIPWLSNAMFIQLPVA